MGVLQAGSAPVRTGRRLARITRATTLAVIALALGFSPGLCRGLRAESPLKNWQNFFRASTSRATRQSAVRAIPLKKLDGESRAKVESVLSDVSIFRRLPLRVIDCNPDLYLFLIQHPDVVVNIWKVLKIASLDLRQIGAGTYRIAEESGTLATVRFLYQSHDTHVIYAEGSYDGPLLARPVKGRCLMVLKTGYVQETNGRHYITSRLDTFVSVDDSGAELFTKAMQPLMGKTADINFVQSMAFLGALSRTAEVNGRGVQRLAAQLTHVTPESRRQLAKLAVEIAQKSTAAATSKASDPSHLASRAGAKPER